TVSHADSRESLGEHTFGKEARARGIVFGADSSCDVVVEKLKPRHARLEKRADGYYFVDLSGDGFTVDDTWHEGGADFRVAEGTRILTSGLEFGFGRAVKPQRTRVMRATETIQSE